MRIPFEKYIHIVKVLVGWTSMPQGHGDFGEDDAKEDFQSRIREQGRVLRQIGLTVTARRADMFADSMNKKGFAWEEFKCNSSELYNVLRCECESKLFLFIPAEKAKYYESSSPFGEGVKMSFPSAAYDIQEAGSSLALGRNTACAFHLVRALERGLAVMAARFDVAWEHRNWQQVIQDIDAKLRELSKSPKTPTEREELEFYLQAASHFMVFKDAYRNFTAHARGKFDEHQAMRLFDNVHGFMEKLASKFSEP